MASHPLQAIGQAVGQTGVDPRVEQRSSLFQGANDGPAKTAAQLIGIQES
jgi:catalase